MTRTLGHFRNWTPVGFSIVVAGLGLAFALTQRSRAGESIKTLAALGNSISSVAQQATQGTRSPTDIADLEAEKRYLEQRLKDCQQPGLVHNSISETVRKIGARIREVKRVATPLPRGGGRVSPYPRFLVALDGTYRQIAQFMGSCSQERLPIRVVAFSIARSDSYDAGQATILSADITVESFDPDMSPDDEPGDAG